MARSLDRASLETLTSTDQTYPDSTQQSGLPLSLDATSIPHVHFSTVMPPNENIPLSQAPPSLQPHTDLQLSSASSLEDGSGQVRTSSDIAQMLASLQSTGELTSFLQQQPALLQELNTLTAGEVSTSSESLRYTDIDTTEEHPSPSKPKGRASKPVVYKEQDRFLPIHNVARIMRNAIPKSGKVSKEAKECMQECVSEFISFITSEASDKCIQEKRKTITGDDILFAMATLGFDNHIEPLKIYLQKYREYTKADKVSSPPQASTNQTNSSQSVVARAIPMDVLRPVTASVPQPLSGTQPLSVPPLSHASAMVQELTGAQL